MLKQINMEKNKTISPIDLDKVIHERMRLGIITALAVHNALAFNDLKEILKASDGNLSVHAKILEDSGYIKTKKAFVSRKPKTTYVITEKGRKELQVYLENMERIIKNTI